jgi:hypothetical protein
MFHKCAKCGRPAHAGLNHLHGLGIHLCLFCTNKVLRAQIGSGKARKTKVPEVARRAQDLAAGIGI